MGVFNQGFGQNLSVDAVAVGIMGREEPKRPVEFPGPHSYGTGPCSLHTNGTSVGFFAGCAFALASFDLAGLA